MENQVGFAAGLLAQTLNGRLPYAASLFTTEMYAVKTGIEELIRSNSPSGSYTIFSDSQSVLLALKSNARSSVMVTQVQQLLYHASVKEIHTDICWVLGHLGIVGNENRLVNQKCCNWSRWRSVDEKFPTQT